MKNFAISYYTTRRFIYDTLRDLVAFVHTICIYGTKYEGF